MQALHLFLRTAGNRSATPRGPAKTTPRAAGGRSRRSSRPTRTSRSTCTRSSRDRRRGLAVEIKALFAGKSSPASRAWTGGVGIVANQPKHKGGVLFVDSADKAARFIWLCDAFNMPLLYLADVPGFMIGTKVERRGSSAPAPR